MWSTEWVIIIFVQEIIFWINVNESKYLRDLIVSLGLVTWCAYTAWQSASLYSVGGLCLWMFDIKFFKAASSIAFRIPKVIRELRLNDKAEGDYCFWKFVHKCGRAPVMVNSGLLDLWRKAELFRIFHWEELLYRLCMVNEVEACKPLI